MRLVHDSPNRSWARKTPATNEYERGRRRQGSLGGVDSVEQRLTCGCSSSREDAGVGEGIDGGRGVALSSLTMPKDPPDVTGRIDQNCMPARRCLVQTSPLLTMPPSQWRGYE